MRRRQSLAIAAGIAVLCTTALGHVTTSRAQAAGPVAEPDIPAIRLATARYRDVKNAIADGYMRDPMNMCVMPHEEGQPDWLGAMGVHYFRPDLLGIQGTSPRVSGNGTHTDFAQPGVLIYDPQADGSMKLVAVENLVFEKGWKAAGHTAPPEYAGHQYFHMVDNPETAADEAHGFAPHYELHIWTELPNPSGPFMEWNPDATCRWHHPDSTKAR